MNAIIKKVIEAKGLVILEAIISKVRDILFEKKEIVEVEVDPYCKMLEALRREFWRWAYFTPEEVIKPGVIVEELTPEVFDNIGQVLDRLTQGRAKKGLPITINSFFRDSEHNARVGGAKESFHKVGGAVDIKIKGLTPLQVAGIFKDYFKGVIVYDTFVHLDLRKTKYHARFKNGIYTKITL